MTDKLYIAYTNTNLTEGRGLAVPFAHSFCEATARRLAKGKGVMGSDASVSSVDIVYTDSGRLIPLRAVFISLPTKEDLTQQELADAKAQAIAKARAAGLSEEDLKVLTK